MGFTGRVIFSGKRAQEHINRAKLQPSCCTPLLVYSRSAQCKIHKGSIQLQTRTPPVYQNFLNLLK